MNHKTKRRNKDGLVFYHKPNEDLSLFESIGLEKILVIGVVIIIVIVTVMHDMGIWQ